MFENLVNGISSAFNVFKSTAKITEKELDKVLEDIKLTLLDADVHYDAVEYFITEVKKEALGEQVHKALSPKQQIIKIVQSTLTKLLGSSNSNLVLEGNPPVIMLVGLQGTGKTTTCVKLAKYLKHKKGKNPLVVGVDFQRPMAVKQLKILAENNGINVFENNERKASRVLKEALAYAKINQNDLIILDTAGRLELNKDLMNELVALKKEFNPSEILLTTDAMQGKSAVDVAKGFNQALDISGFILSKLDSDTRGGAALSLYYTTKKPIKFMGVGEKAEDFELFYPDRLANRILDFGDLLSLIEKAESTFDKNEAEKLEKKLAKNTFDIEDFLSQIKQIKKLGSLESIIGLIPGMGNLKAKLGKMAPPEEELKKIEAIICSMTIKERKNPNIINSKRRIRIAKGSGTQISDVNRFLKQFEDMKKLIKNLPKSGNPGLKGLGNFKL